MPQVVTHFLIPALLVAIFRDFYLRKKEKRTFPLHYVFITGIAGLLPDLDFIVLGILSLFGAGATYSDVHRTFSHSLLLPLFLFLIAIPLRKVHLPELGKHRLNLGIIFMVLAFGIFTHTALDATLQGKVALLTPISNIWVGGDLLQIILPEVYRPMSTALLDAGTFVLWILYLKFRHKITDVI